MPRQWRPLPRRAGFEGLRNDHCTPGLPQPPAHGPHGDHDDHPQSTVGDTGSPGDRRHRRGDTRAPETPPAPGVAPATAPLRDPPEQPGWGRQCRRRPSRQVQMRHPSGTGVSGGYLRPPARHGHSRGRTHPAGPAPASGASSTCPAGHQHPARGGGVRGCPTARGAPLSPPGCPSPGRQGGGRGQVTAAARSEQEAGQGAQGSGRSPSVHCEALGHPPGAQGAGTGVRHRHRLPHQPPFPQGSPIPAGPGREPPCPTRTPPVPQRPLTPRRPRTHRAPPALRSSSVPGTHRDPPPLPPDPPRAPAPWAPLIPSDPSQTPGVPRTHPSPGLRGSPRAAPRRRGRRSGGAGTPSCAAGPPRSPPGTRTRVPTGPTPRPLRVERVKGGPRTPKPLGLWDS